MVRIARLGRPPRRRRRLRLKVGTFAIVLGAAGVPLALTWARRPVWLLPSAGAQGEVAEALPEGTVITLDALPRDAAGAPDLANLPFVSRRVEPDPALRARVEALAAARAAMGQGLTRATAASVLNAVPPADPKSAARMDSGDSNPDRLGEPPFAITR